MKKKLIGLTIFLGIILGGIATPVSSTYAQTNTQILYQPNVDYEAALSRLGSCSLTEWTPCLLKVYYAVVMYPSYWFVYMTGAIFDYFLAYSIDTESYTGTNNEFVERGWSVIRDIANITFIFALLYVAIVHILQADSSKTKKFLKDIIIAAILINFSLFFTKVIIDGGNILARAFYNNIEVENDDSVDYKTLSQGIASYVKPQTILTAKFFNPVLAPGREPSPPSAGWIFLILTLAAVVNVIIGLTFLSTFLLFAARVIGLWFMMIFSPLAFVSIAFPWGKGILGRFSFSNWLKETVSLSFMAPVFLFFLFLLIMFLQIVYTSNVPVGDRSSIQEMLSVIIPFIAIILILTMAKKQAKEMAGEIGQQTAAWTGKIAGFAATGVLGVAGGAALVSRFAIGGAATAFSKSRLLRKGLTSNNRFFRGVSRAASTASRAASRSSFDPRNTWVGKRTGQLAQLVSQGATGQKMSTSIFGYNASKGSGVGGYRKWQKDKIKENVNEQRKRAVEEDLKEEDLASLVSAKKAMESAKTNFDRIKQEFDEISSKRVPTAEERDKFDKAREYRDSTQNKYNEEKNRVDIINRRRREERAKWQNRYFWKQGNRKAAESVLKGEKPEEKDEVLEMIKDFRKWQKDKDKDKDNA